jgi:hypothetical protein
MTETKSSTVARPKPNSVVGAFLKETRTTMGLTRKQVIGHINIVLKRDYGTTYLGLLEEGCPMPREFVDPWSVFLKIKPEDVRVAIKAYASKVMPPRKRQEVTLVRLKDAVSFRKKLPTLSQTVAELASKLHLKDTNIERILAGKPVPVGWMPGFLAHFRITTDDMHTYYLDAKEVEKKAGATMHPFIPFKPQSPTTPTPVTERVEVPVLKKPTSLSETLKQAGITTFSVDQLAQIEKVQHELGTQITVEQAKMVAVFWKIQKT